MYFNVFKVWLYGFKAVLSQAEECWKGWRAKWKKWKSASWWTTQYLSELTGFVCRFDKVRSFSRSLLHWYHEKIVKERHLAGFLCTLHITWNPIKVCENLVSFRSPRASSSWRFWLSLAYGSTTSLLCTIWYTLISL